jgi:hypothetical protein
LSKVVTELVRLDTVEVSVSDSRLVDRLNFDKILRRKLGVNMLPSPRGRSTGNGGTTSGCESNSIKGGMPIPDVGVSDATCRAPVMTFWHLGQDTWLRVKKPA